MLRSRIDLQVPCGEEQVRKQSETRDKVPLSRAWPKSFSTDTRAQEYLRRRNDCLLFGMLKHLK